MAASKIQHRVFCWTNPRCLSTAFMRCLGNTDGAIAWLEPFGTAEYRGPDGRLSVSIQKEVPQLPLEPEYEHTCAWIKESLEGDFGGHSLVFVKDFAFAVADRFQFLPEGYHHSFLIRRPLKSFMSYYRAFKKIAGSDTETMLKSKLPQKGFGYGELAELADYVEKDLGQPLVIVDADDIINHPYVIVERYCEAMGLPFSADMLAWNPGMPSNWIVAESHLKQELETFPWMGNALDSRGFQKGLQKSRPGSAEEVPCIVREMVSVAQPFYDKLHARRILPS